MAESVLAPSIQDDAGLRPPLQGLREPRKAAVMVVVPVADDQGVGLGWIYLQPLIVVGKAPRGQREIKKNLLPLRPSERLQVEG